MGSSLDHNENVLIQILIRLEFAGDELGVKLRYDDSDTMPGRSFFVGKVVVMNNDFEKNRFYEMDVTNGLNGTFSVETKNTDKDVLLATKSR